MEEGRGEKENELLRLNEVAAPSYTSSHSSLGEIIASSEEGSMKLQQDAPKGHLQIIVEDSGVGISPDEQGNLFKPFE